MRGAVLAVLLAAVAPAQSDFAHWMQAAPGRAQEVRAFEAYLHRAGVGGVLPLPPLLLNSSSWAACADAPYSLPPRALWPNIVPTLRFVRARIVPALGPVAALSGYRSPALNKCSGGAPKSAHAQYFALDLTPLQFKDRGKMIAAVCALHARYGPAAQAGLGFYSGMRFHIDTMGFRRWGADFHGATSPCLALAAKGWTRSAREPVRGGASRCPAGSRRDRSPCRPWR
ncbi:MAG: D-Ala-D-Ala carboxypeptidase family metallohydrolase [Rhizomicrobium sp.]